MIDRFNDVIARFVYSDLNQNVPDYAILTWYRIATDLVGSVKYVMRETNGTPYQLNSYDPWGAVTAGSFSYVPFSFAGGLYDPDTKLVHFGAREYDPAVGRWISKAPILFDGGQENLHVAGNEPVNRRDPYGELSWGEGVAVAGCAQ